jgi:threonyl-tRNA synthetase
VAVKFHAVLVQGVFSPILVFQTSKRCARPLRRFLGHAWHALGREWQVATIQLDINMPERFDLSCINEKGEKERIVMIHAAIMGSLERFLSIFIEHHAGLFPLWCAPVQIVMLPIAEPHEAYAAEVADLLRKRGIRLEVMDHTNSIGKRIREAEKQRVPYVLVIGDKEVEDCSVSVRNVATKEQVVVRLDEFIEKTVTDIVERKLKASIG